MGHLSRFRDTQHQPLRYWHSGCPEGMSWFNVLR